MNNKKMNELVGKSFEDLSIEEMQQLQGSQRYNEQVTPTVVVVISSVEISEAVSALVSALSAATVSMYLTKKKKCTK